MDEAVRLAAERAAQLTITRSKSVALGQPPGPPLGTPRRGNNRKNLETIDETGDVDGTPLDPNQEDGTGETLEDTHLDGTQLLNGSLLDSESDDGISWHPPVDKGQERASTITSPTPSQSPSSPTSRYKHLDPVLRVADYHDPISVDLHIHRRRSNGESDCTKFRSSPHRATDCPADPNTRVIQLYNEGRYAEGATLLKYLMETTSDRASTRTSRPPVAGGSGLRQAAPVASGSGLPHARPYALIADLPSSSDEGDMEPLAKRTHTNRREAPQARQAAILRPATQVVDQRPTLPRVPPTPVVPRQLAGDPYHSRPSNAIPHVLDAPSHPLSDKEEAELVKSLMTSKKGRLVLRNGDVVENGRLLVADTTEEMDKTLTLLSPVLSHWLKTFKSYIPLTVFNKYFLVEDQIEWGRRKAPTESRIDDGSASLRFEEWIDSIALFIKYVAEAGWPTLASRFEGHRSVVIDLRENYGWMIALRYCRRVRQGVMRETTDNRIKNFSKLQSAIFEEARLTADANQERAYRTNPYAPGGPLTHINPLTNQPRASATSSSTLTKKTPTLGITARSAKADYPRPTGETWIPSSEWKLMSDSERKAATNRRYGGSAKRRTGESYGSRERGDRDRDYDRGYDRNYREREDRSKYRCQSRSRSRSPRGRRGKGKGRIV
ncbi:uncharacterized protein MELLADRAFT_84329 [Melampsora larici-populina 98AG31]|uniref:Uncharacterized protein n=1 Tax=Melampsora larici-populina (strain 98AG31 / pathotype 3-4-7) TaxID=747676 RepID=F4RFC5_MELLP|nr:uncharacterized protein MELLADRAFT_84329 [Melampsora larici-populina 98AG31]EGG08791.1 hypothetical protein MELLADRAFT_84329 [Melampsora larici-populina 98AG31]